MHMQNIFYQYELIHKHECESFVVKEVVVA